MGAEIRNLGYLAWRNDLGWMEEQTGERWNQAVSSENRQFSQALKQSESIRKKFKGRHKSTRATAPEWNYKGWTSEAVTGFSPEVLWSFQGGKFKIRCFDADIDERRRLMAAAIPDPGGYERFSIEVYSMQKGPQRIAQIKGPAGPYVAWFGGFLIWLGSTADLRYDSINVWDPESKSSEEIYRLQSPEENLELLRGEDQTVYVVASDYATKRIGMIGSNGKSIRWTKEAKDLFYVSADEIIVDGKAPFKLPSDQIFEAMSRKAGWLITRSYGIRTLWDTRRELKSMVTVWGEIYYDTRDPFWLDIVDMRYEPYVIQLPSWKLSNPAALPFPCIYMRHPNPMFIAYPSENVDPLGLLVTAYGAYGDPTKVGSLIARWELLLHRGWAVAAVNVPGSGDHDDRWRRRGQREHRQEAIDALHKSILDLQEELGVSPKATALYGRSAGGLLAISTAVQHPEIVGALYVECPYVDILRTMSNPKLPLTLLETKEFGTGERATNILATGSWSPMEHIPAEGLKDIFIVARTDEADLQVYPYEVMKFIWRARASGLGDAIGDQPKLLKIHKGLGHFATTRESRLEDLSLLEYWRQNTEEKLSPEDPVPKKPAPRRKNLGAKYKMLPSRKNRSRKNRRSTRRNRNNNVGGSNVPMMGGKRRRGTRHRRNRKH